MQTTLFTTSAELELTELRSRLAREFNVEPNKIWPAKVTIELVRMQPKTLVELEAVKGITKKKVRDFGSEILSIFGTRHQTTTNIITSPHSPEAIYQTRPETLEKVLGVSDYLDYINHILKVVENVKVIGEISRISNHPTGIYMTLKDKNGDGVLDCYINPYTYRGLGLMLEEGMEVKAAGTPGIFKRRSQLSLKIESVELSGEGTLKKSYELLKLKLEQEGIFDRKRELPEFISSIGIITSKTGAVIDDFRNNLELFGSKLYMKDCRVEGNQAANQILRAIKYFNTYHPELDCLVIMRGGGSLEDMQAFNSELVVKEIFASRIPVIAALGHDRDVPLACLAADKYTSTPTAAAMLINSSYQRLREALPRFEQQLIHKFEAILAEQQSDLSRLVHQLTGSFNSIFQQFKFLEEKMLRNCSAMGNAINTTRSRAQALIAHALQQTSRQLQFAMASVLSAEKLLQSANPERNLRLGYSLVYTSDGKLVRNTAQAERGSILDIRLNDGTINTTVN